MTLPVLLSFGSFFNSMAAYCILQQGILLLYRASPRARVCPVHGWTLYSPLFGVSATNQLYDLNICDWWGSATPCSMTVLLNILRVHFAQHREGQLDSGWISTMFGSCTKLKPWHNMSFSWDILNLVFNASMTYLGVTLKENMYHTAQVCVSCTTNSGKEFRNLSLHVYLFFEELKLLSLSLASIRKKFRVWTVICNVSGCSAVTCNVSGCSACSCTIS